MRYARHLAAISICLEWILFLPPAALAGEPAALIESVTGVAQGIEPMDYVPPGKVISLGAHERLVIDYLGSCLHEIIAGGTVTIGTERSTVVGGHVERERVRCDGGRLNLSTEQAQASAGTVSRFQKKAHPLPPGLVVERRLYGASPIFDLGGETSLSIERLDIQEDSLDIVNAADHLLRGRFYDFAANKRALSPGGIYRATVGQHSLVFQIDRSAKPGKAPLVGRLLRF